MKRALPLKTRRHYLRINRGSTNIQKVADQIPDNASPVTVDTSHYGVSVLIFSRNDVWAALDIVKELYDFADQIVIIDSSEAEKHEELLSAKLKKGYHKLDIFKAVALGYVEPLREFGLKKCMHDWVLYLDTDERISEAFKRSLKDLVSRKEISGFQVFRIDIDDSLGQPSVRHGGWHIRLFNRSLTKYAGNIHEQPSVRGRVSILERDYCIYHYINSKYDKNKLSNYFVVESMTRRLRYSDIMLLLKKPALSYMVSGYARTTGKTINQELTRLDYMILSTAKILQSKLDALKRSISFGELYDSLRYAVSYNRDKINFFFSVRKRSDDIFLSISGEIIDSGGLINYLHLDQESVVNALTNRLGPQQKPLDNLRTILLLRHEKGSDYFAFL